MQMNLNNKKGMLQKETLDNIILCLGKDILESDGMCIEKACLQHGQYSVYDHSIKVAELCVKIADQYHIQTDMRSLVRGALLHDYFLYDWHEPDRRHQFHAFSHAACALYNAERDFKLTDIERNMIKAHMFPLYPVFPKYRESMILCLADKICATRETLSGFSLKVHRKRGGV